MVEPSLEVVRAFLNVGVPTVCDVLDLSFGIRGYMNHEIKPLFRSKIAGRAVTLKQVAYLKPQSNPFQHVFDAVDACGPGWVYVATNGGNRTVSLMGDLVAIALQARGAEGAVLDGAVRDIDPIIKTGFPVFASSVSPVSAKHKAIAIGHNIPIECGGVQVNPGDVVVGDWDGVVVIPANKAEVVLEESLKLEKKEKAMGKQIRKAIKRKRLADIFAEFK